MREVREAIAVEVKGYSPHPFTPQADTSKPPVCIMCGRPQDWVMHVVHKQVAELLPRR